jgi:outer membrane protein TolC
VRSRCCSGRYPAAEIELPTGLIALPPPVATGVPSDLLERRPDIVAAERRFAASFARRGRGARGAAAENLAERGGVIAHEQHLRAQDRLQPSAGGAVAVFFPIFNAGQLEAQVELRTAEQKQAGAAYAQLALKAFNEVETALASESSLAARERVLRQGLSDSRRGARTGAGTLSGRFEGPCAVSPSSSSPPTR